jgi:hypothetical protein
VQVQDLPAAVIAREVARADVVIVEIVERTLVGGSSRVLGDARLDAIQNALGR